MPAIKDFAVITDVEDISALHVWRRSRFLSREALARIHRAHQSYKISLEKSLAIAHIVGHTALKQFAFFMFISATHVAVFVLNIGYELISACLTRYC